MKRSNQGFEKENICLVKERKNNLQLIHDLTTEKSQLEESLSESHASYKELLDAKEMEAKNFNNGINKLIKFKNQCKELLQKDKQVL